MTRKQDRPSAARNREPIRQVLAGRVPEKGFVLEIAAGSGQHAVHMAEAFPGLVWQPTDIDPEALESIAAYVADGGLPNLRAPARLDVHDDPWPFDEADVITCVNMIHISPWSATENLFRGAGQRLSASGFLYTYGPYRFDGEFTAPSNEMFDESLRSRDPSWGVRDVADLKAVAERHGLELAETVEMPANNHSLVFRRV